MRMSIILTAWLCLAACGQGQPETYPQPVTSKISRSASLSASCSGCHSIGGAAISDLSKYSGIEITELLRSYARDPEGTTVMHRLARGYSEEDILAIGEHFGSAMEGK